MASNARQAKSHARFARHTRSSTEAPRHEGEFRFDTHVTDRIGHLFESIGTSDFYPSLTELLRTAANFDDVYIIKYRAGSPPSAPYTSLTDSPPETLTAYVKGLYMQSPFYEMSKKGKSGFNALRDVAPDDFFESDLYQTCMSPSHLQDEAAFVIQDQGGVSYHLSLGRTEDLSQYTQSEIDALSRMTPIVEQSVLRHEHLCHPVPEAEPQQQSTSAKLKLSDITPESLTDREREIVGYLVRGYSSKACARELDISPATERVHRKNIYEKLGVNSQSELLASVFESLLE